MAAERFRVRDLEFVLAPGLNLLVCPSAQTLELVWGGLKDALAAPDDDLVFSPEDWAAFASTCAWRPVGEVVVAAGMRGGRRLPLVKHRLRRELETLYLPKARGPALNRALTELARVQKELKALGDPAVKIADLGKRVEALSTRSEAARAQLERIEREQELFGRLVAALPDLGRVLELEAERRRLSHVADFPRDGVDKLAALKAQLERVEAKKAALEAQSEPADLERTDPGRIDPDALVDRITVLLDVHRLWDVQLRALPERIDAISWKRRELEKALAQLEVSGAAAADDPSGMTAALDEGRLCLEHRRVFSSTATAVRERVESEIRRLSSEAMSLSPTLSSARVRAQLVALESLRERSDGVVAAEGEVEAAHARREMVAAAEQVRPTELLSLRRAAGVGAVIVAAAVGGVLWGGVNVAVLSALAGLGGLCALGYAYLTLRRRYLARVDGWRAAERERQAELSRLDGEAALAQDRLRRAKDLLDAAERDAGCAHDAVAERVDARRHALRVLLSQVERREDVARQMEAYAALMAVVAQEENRARVDKHVAEARLSGLQREASAAAPGGAALLKRRAMQLRVEEAALAADWKACARAGELLLHASRAMDVSVRDLATVPVALESLRESLAEEAERRRSARADRGRTDAEREQCLAERAELAEAMFTLLRDGHAADEAEFARHFREAQELDQVEGRLREAARLATDAAALPLAELKARVEEEGGAQAVTRKRTRLAERATRLRGQLARLDHDRSRAAVELDAWRRGEAVDALARRQADLIEEADVLVSQWARDRLALGLIERRVNAWRKEARARIVEQASREFGRLTGGAFVHVGLSGEDDASLIVTDEKLEQLRADELLPGNRALLYLSFRLAMVEDAAAGGALVFRGALAGFSRNELSRIAEVLARMSEKHQVIVLTRQPLVRDLFEEQGAHGVEVDELEADAAA